MKSQGHEQVGRTRTSLLKIASAICRVNTSSATAIEQRRAESFKLSNWYEPQGELTLCSIAGALNALKAMERLFHESNMEVDYQRFCAAVATGTRYNCSRRQLFVALRLAGFINLHEHQVPQIAATWRSS